MGCPDLVLGKTYKLKNGFVAQVDRMMGETLTCPYEVYTLSVIRPKRAQGIEIEILDGDVTGLNFHTLDSNDFAVIPTSDWLPMALSKQPHKAYKPDPEKARANNRNYRRRQPVEPGALRRFYDLSELTKNMINKSAAEYNYLSRDQLADLFGVSVGTLRRVLSDDTK